MQLNDYELLYYCYQENEFSFELLANKYERYIYYIINLYKKKYFFFSSEDIDLHNEALILLYECVYSYRDDLNVKFSSYFLACLKKKYLFLIRNLTNNKNKTHALAMSLDSCPSNNDLDLYSVISNNDLSIAEQVYNDYLVGDAIKIMKNTLSELENKIIFYYLHGYSYNDISMMLGVENKKIDNTIQKYKKLVRKAV
ncbi:RNA polymerase sporulation-specific sigma factor [Bacilli bacterium PM5-9]|nr:RNA polymerase sporulation-specific sigma factor [Bacilli bacterium PM5-9]